MGMVEPIATLVIFYNRPHTLREMLSALEASRPQVLYLASDGPKSAYDWPKILECRSIVEDISWECKVERLYSNSNLGLNERFATAMNYVLTKEKGVLVMEDDCIPHPEIFRYIQSALDVYGLDKSIATLSCLNPLGRTPSFRNFPFSLNPSLHSGGWYIKKTHWDEFWAAYTPQTWSITKCLVEALKYRGVFTKALRLKILLSERKKLEPGDILLNKFFFDRGYVSVMPKVSMVRNIGSGKTATHTQYLPRYGTFSSDSAFLDWSGPSPNRVLGRVDVLEGWLTLWGLPSWLKFKITKLQKRD